MLELLYASGIKVSELVNLNTHDINMELRFLRCAVSGGKERILPITQIARERGFYMQDMRDKLIRDADEDALFLNSLGTRLTRQGFWKIIKSMASWPISMRRSRRIPFAIRLLFICRRTAPTCVRFRRCWVTRHYPPPACINPPRKA